LDLTSGQSSVSHEAQDSWEQGCLAAVRQHDRDRYLASLFAPQQKRRSLLVLYAFNLEVGRIPEVVSEQMLGEIRLQWWREALDSAYENRPRNHPVVQGLAETISRTPLNRADFDRLLNARGFDLEAGPPKTTDDLEDYAEATSSGLLRLGLEVLESANEAEMRAVSRLGVAWALIGVARSLPFHARQNRIYLPKDLMTRCGVTSADVLSLRPAPAINECVHGLVELAERHLTACRDSGRRVSRKALPILLLARAASQYAYTLRAAGCNPYDPHVAQELPGMVWRLAWSYLLNRF